MNEEKDYTFITGDVNVIEQDNTGYITPTVRGKVLIYILDLPGGTDTLTLYTSLREFEQRFPDTEYFDPENSEYSLSAIRSVKFLLRRGVPVVVYDDDAAAKDIASVLETLLKAFDSNTVAILLDNADDELDDLNVPATKESFLKLLTAAGSVPILANIGKVLKAGTATAKPPYSDGTRGSLNDSQIALFNGTVLTEEGFKIPLSVAVAELISRNARNGQPYATLFGQKALLDVKGVSPFTREEHIKFTNSGINLPLYKQGVGFYLRSASTMENVREDGKFGPLAHLSVRVLTNAIKLKVGDISEAFIGEFNNTDTWSRWSLEVSKYLRTFIGSTGALKKYDVKIGVPETMTPEQVADGLMVGQVDIYPSNLIDKVTVYVTLNAETGTVSIS